MDDPLTELQVLTSKRSSLRDKLKKRREALGSILAQTSAEPATSNTTIPAKVSVTSTSPSKTLQNEANTPEKAREIEDVKRPKLDIPSPASENQNATSPSSVQSAPRKRTSTSDSESKQDDLLSLLQAQSAKEKADQQHRDEIMELLGKLHFFS